MISFKGLGDRIRGAVINARKLPLASISQSQWFSPAGSGGNYLPADASYVTLVVPSLSGGAEIPDAENSVFGSQGAEAVPYPLKPACCLFEPAFQPRHIVSDKRQAKRQHPQTENWQNRKNPTSTMSRMPATSRNQKRDGARSQCTAARKRAGA